MSKDTTQTTCNRCGGTKDFMGDPCTCIPITKTTSWGDLVTKWSDDDLKRMALMIHYPKCWDTASYPTLGDAIYSIVVGVGCSEHPLPAFKDFPSPRRA